MPGKEKEGIIISLYSFKAQFCNKSFKRPQDLKKHEKIHSDQHIAQLRSHRHHHSLTPVSQSSRDNSPVLSEGNSSSHPISPPQSIYSDGNIQNRITRGLIVLQQNYRMSTGFILNRNQTMVISFKIITQSSCHKQIILIISYKTSSFLWK